MVPIRVILGLYWGYMGDNGKENGNYYNGFYGWLVKIMVPFWVPIIIRPLIFRVPKKKTIILTTTHMEVYVVSPFGKQYSM